MLCCSVVIVVHRCLLLSVCRLVCFRGYRRRRCEFVNDRLHLLHLRHRSSYQVRGSIYHAYNFHLTVPSSRIERLLDPTTYIYASMLNLKQPCPSTSQETMYCYVTLLAAQPLLSMHARILFSLTSCYSLDWAITLLLLLLWLI